MNEKKKKKKKKKKEKRAKRSPDKVILLMEIGLLDIIVGRFDLREISDFFLHRFRDKKDDSNIEGDIPSRV